MRKYLIFAFILLAGCMCSQAQNPIRWRTSVKMTSESAGVLTVKAIVTEGWHLYGTKLPADGPKPTVLDFNASSGVKFLEPFKPSIKPVEKTDAAFGMTLNWWDKTVTFSRRFKLTGKKADATIKGMISYMACNDENCTPPRTETIGPIQIK